MSYNPALLFLSWRYDSALLENMMRLHYSFITNCWVNCGIYRGIADSEDNWSLCFSIFIFLKQISALKEHRNLMRKKKQTENNFKYT